MLPGTAGAALAAAALPRRRAAPTRRTVLHAQPLAWLHAPVVSSHGTDARQLKANFSGVWVKDRAASDDMGEALALMRVGGLLRQAIKLIRGVEIRQDGASFSMAVFSVLSWFKVTERYALDGSSSKCRRRDFRRGGHSGRVSAPTPACLRLHLTWGEPLGGTGADDFSMPNQDTLHVDSTITVAGRTCRYRSVYRRKR